MVKNIAILGGSGAIGSAFKDLFTVQFPDAHIASFSRSHELHNDGLVTYRPINFDDEASIQEAANFAADHQPLDIVIVTNGILCEGDIRPEKSLRELSAEKFQRIYYVNTIIPALIAKYFVPKLNRQSRSIFAALSARVGSIGDNRIGGWYSYRASKAALNMVIKNIAIETGRKNQQAIIVGLHPGTVDSALSKPFQSHIPDQKLFTPAYSAEKLWHVLGGLSFDDSGHCFAWDGQRIEP